MKNRNLWPVAGGMATVCLLALGGLFYFGPDAPPRTVPALDAQTDESDPLPVVTPGRGRSSSASASASARGTIDETWQVMHLDGQRIGYAHSLVQEVVEDGRRGIRAMLELQMGFKRFGQSVEMHKSLKTEETEDGRLLAWELEIRNPPAETTRSVGRRDGNRLVIDTTLAGRTQRTFLDCGPDVKSPLWQDRLLRRSPLKPGETRSFQAFVPDYAKLSTVRIAADDHRFVRLLDGRSHKLLKLSLSQSILPTLTTRVYVDDAGTPLRTDDDLGGKTLVAYQVDQQEALKTLAGAELDLAVGTLIPVSPIHNAHRARRAVYRITIADDDPANYVVADETQEIKRLAADAIELTVTAPVLPADTKKVPAPAEFLSATQFLQSDDLRVIEHARRAAGGQTDPRRTAIQMEQYVHRKLSKKNFSTALASAAEVARNLEGDCTEHAVLLAAMLRAADIPSRVAVGLVYVDGSSSFGGHMWTEAWLGGRWFPLDATLGRGGIGPAHIKLADASLADDAPAPVTSFLPLLKVLGRIKIEVVEVR